jgi:hypothetical protein
VLLAHDVDHRRLLQIDLQRLVQRRVKDGITGMVHKIRQDQGVFRRLGGDRSPALLADS